MQLRVEAQGSFQAAFIPPHKLQVQLTRDKTETTCMPSLAHVQ